MKKAVGIFVALLMVVFLQPSVAQAEDQKVLAIIDTAMDSNKNASIIHEVCIISIINPDMRRYCVDGTVSNKVSFREGKGAANVRDWTVKGIDHGYDITQVANQVAPDVKIVFIRIGETTSLNTTMSNTGSVAKAVEWVANNASRFSIDAVSISQATVVQNGVCPVNATFDTSVQQLKAQGITVYAGTGNNQKATGPVLPAAWPACATDVVGVGATKPDGTLATYTQSGVGMDVTFRGDARVIAYRNFAKTIIGTSVATPGFAAAAVNQK